ncbi:MAG: thiol:disulfide interchange protein DsbD [Idiomarinaceae bacterium HL-53]|nr:MAG: thiol:disulfide interchange protein DsbD [Idiomarinaceae bacterium HL-53]CUS48210.1 Disulphide bond corrector protein DsbC [Idiomarinaceae bacterium HL-53]
MKKLFLLNISFLALISFQANAQSTSLADALANQGSQFPPPEEVFVLDYQQIDHELTITFDIRDGFYLYQHRFGFEPEGKLAGPLSLPEGIAYADEFFGDSIIYREQVTFNVPLNAARRNEPLTLKYQGCADEGFCYPPSTQTIYLRQTEGLNASVDSTSTASNRSENSEEIPFWLVLIGIIGVGFVLWTQKDRWKTKD